MWLYFIFIMLFLFYPSFYLCVMFVSSAVSAPPCFRTLPLPPLLPPYLVRAEPKTGWAKQGGQHHDDDDDDDNDTHTHTVTWLGSWGCIRRPYCQRTEEIRTRGIAYAQTHTRMKFPLPGQTGELDVEKLQGDW